METMEKEVFEVYLDDIIPNRFQPREKFNDESINNLSESIKKYGVIQPLVLRKIGDKYEIIAGERRYKASSLAGLEKVPAVIRNLDDAESAEVALIENLQRENLTAIEKARSYKKLLAMSGDKQEELAKKLGVSQSGLANTLRLLNLDDVVQSALLNRKISERHARSLLQVSDKEKQKDLLNKVIAERLTVRKLDSIIKGEVSEEPAGAEKIIEDNPLLKPERELESTMEKELNPRVEEIPEEKTVEPEMVPAEELGNTQPQELNLDKEIIAESVAEEPVAKEAPLIQPKAPVAEEPTPEPVIEEVPVPEENLAESMEEKRENPEIIAEPVAEEPSILDASPMKDIEAIKENAEDITAEETKPDFGMLLQPDKTEEPQMELPKEEKIIDFPGNVEANLDDEKANMDFGAPQNKVPQGIDVESESDEGEEKTPVMEPLLQPQEPIEKESPVAIEPSAPEPVVEKSEPVVEKSEPVEMSPLMQELKTESNMQTISKPVVEQAPTPAGNSTPQGPPQGDLRTAINTIRRSVDIIEKNGIVIDSDEMDLPDEYQITIKITKNK